MASVWPYHRNPHGDMVKCANNPCTRHPDDIMATSPEEAYAKLMERSGSTEPGMRTEPSQPAKGTAADNGAKVMDVDYDGVKSEQSPVDSFSVKSFIRDNVDGNGMLKSSWSSHADFTKQMRERHLIDTKRLSDEEQDEMLAIAENKGYMDKALEGDDGFPESMYKSMPAATEMINDLSTNETTSSKSLSRIVDIAVARRGNPQFRRQVYVSNIANHRNLSEGDAKRLYNAYPEECVRAQRFNKTIINDALRSPTTPDSVRAIAITNPNATVDAMEAAIAEGGDVYRAQALLNPNGRYMDVARRERKKAIKDRNDMAEFENDQKALDRFRKRLRERVGTSR